LVFTWKLVQKRGLDKKTIWKDWLHYVKMEERLYCISGEICYNNMYDSMTISCGAV